jgi:hypothetical protein
MTVLTHRMEAEAIADAREMVQMILRDWDRLTWDTLLADDVNLSFKLRAVHATGGFGAIGRDLHAAGRDHAKRALKEVYSDLREGLLVTTEIVSGYDAILLGNFSRPSGNEITGDLSFPIVLHMEFGDEGKIKTMTIAAADLHSLIDSVRKAAQRSGQQAG